MSSDDGKENPKEGPKNKSQQANQGPVWSSVSRTQRIIAEAAVLALYFLFEAHSIWPESHGWALFQGAFGTCAVLAIEMPLMWCVPTCFVIGVGSAVAYSLLGPAMPPPTIGWLQPGNDPRPPNGCDKDQVAQSIKDRPLVILGTFGIFPAKTGSYAPMQIGSCEPITIEQGDLGAAISADIFSPAGHVVGHIRKDSGYEILGAKNLIVEKSGNLSTVVVHDAGRNELLYMRYVNPNTIQLRGIFSCPTQTIPDGKLVIAAAPSLTFPGHAIIRTGCDTVGTGKLISIY